MVEPLRNVLVQAPTSAFGSAFENPTYGYLRPVDLAVARLEHEYFCELLDNLGVTVHQLDADSDSPDLIYTYDASLITSQGAILLNSGKATRRGEEQVHRDWYGRAGIPIIGEIDPPGTVDGGDVMWLRNDMMVVGRSLRTNQFGIGQLESLLGSGVIVFDVPVYRGAAACLHLMSSISMVSERLAVVESPLLPSGLYRLIGDLGIELIDVPGGEVETLAGNVLAIRPGVVVAVDGNPITRSALEERGVEVHSFGGAEIAINGTGGPTCVTRPILRR